MNQDCPPSRHATETQPADRPGVGIGALVYSVAWSSVALEVVVLLAHLTAKMLFNVEDLDLVLSSVLGFSLVIWVGASLILLPVLLSALLRRVADACSAPKPELLRDPWLDD